MNPIVLHCIALIALIASLGGVRAGEIGSSSDQKKELTSGLDDDAESVLGFWAGCSVQDDTRVEQLSAKLCEPVSGKVGEDAHDVIRRILRNAKNDLAALCAVDSAVVRSLERCPSLRQQEDVAVTASILLGLADAWRQQGGDERAGQLYRHTNLLLESGRGSRLKRMKVLGAWTMHELQRGELGHAKELADQYVRLARERHQTGDVSSNELIRGLELQASVLRRLGLAAEAQAAEEEAKRLAAVSGDCDGLCGEPFRILCKDNAAGELVCARQE